MNSSAPGQLRNDDVYRGSHVPGEEGVWVFIFGDMMIFLVLFLTYLYYRSQNVALFRSGQETLSLSAGLANTFLLLISSLAVALGVQAIKQSRNRLGSASFTVAFCCGAAFCGTKVFEYGAKFKAGLTPNTDDFYSFYFALTGIHLLHLILGMVLLAFMSLAARRSSAPSLAFYEGAGCFWHLVDLLWIMLFPLLYLLH